MPGNSTVPMTRGRRPGLALQREATGEEPASPRPPAHRGAEQGVLGRGLARRAHVARRGLPAPASSARAGRHRWAAPRAVRRRRRRAPPVDSTPCTRARARQPISAWGFGALRGRRAAREQGLVAVLVAQAPAPPSRSARRRDRARGSGSRRCLRGSARRRRSAPPRARAHPVVGGAGLLGGEQRAGQVGDHRDLRLGEGQALGDRSNSSSIGSISGEWKAWLTRSRVVLRLPLRARRPRARSIASARRRPPPRRAVDRRQRERRSSSPARLCSDLLLGGPDREHRAAVGQRAHQPAARRDQRRRPPARTRRPRAPRRARRPSGRSGSRGARPTTQTSRYSATSSANSAGWVNSV